MRLAIVGSRNFNNKSLMAHYLAMIMLSYQDSELGVPDVEIISGGASGADAMGEKFAHIYQVPITVFRPKWNELGKSAGFIRNKQIVDACDMVLAFWDGNSKGTKHTIDLAKEAKKPTFIVYF